MSVPHLGLIAIVVVMLSLPVMIWIAGWVSRTLARYDAQVEQRDRDQVAAALDAHDADGDPLFLIEALIHDEVDLIRNVLDVRFSGQHPSPEQVASLRLAHRRGLAARQRCGDEVLDAELGWLQGYGTIALTADVSEIDRAEFERDLNYRSAELRRALAHRRAVGELGPVVPSKR